MDSLPEELTDPEPEEYAELLCQSRAGRRNGGARDATSN